MALLPAASVVIAAHNEEDSIGALLEALTRDAAPGALEVVVVCNGCTDGTVEAARRFEPLVRIVDLPQPSKRSAQIAGDAVATVFPRAYVDADVLITSTDLHRLTATLRDGPALAAAPTRRLDLTGASRVVRSYYRVWERLPQVRAGLFGRGVVVVSEEGAERVLGLPHVLSDDLVMSEAFGPEEVVVDPISSVVVKTPRTVQALLRRRVRVVTGNAQVDRLGLRRPSSSTSVPALVRLVRAEPGRSADALVFVLVTAAARFRARRAVRTGDFSTWLRDDSSRTPTDG